MVTVSSAAPKGQISRSASVARAIAIPAPSRDRLSLSRKQPRDGQVPPTLMGKLTGVGECALAGAAIVGVIALALSGGAIPMMLGGAALGGGLAAIAGVISEI